MKNTIKEFRIIALAVIIAFSMAACNKGGSSGSANAQSGGKTLNSAEALKEYLDSQPVNGPDKPIKVSMTINNPMLYKVAEVIKSAGKYVSLNITGNALTTITDDFKSCEALVSINIPNSVTEIDDEAFLGLTSLTEINVDSGNTNYISDQGILYNKDKTSLMLYPKRKAGAYIMPNSVTDIENYAISGCTSLTSVTISNGITFIYGDFRGCTSLASVTIPNSVTHIDDLAFDGCTSLASITIPSSVTSIDGYAFRGCTSLTSVTFQGTIGRDNFAGGYGSRPAFEGDLRTKYLAGGIGTYTTTAPVNWDSKWTKQ
jgi:hypothetical protein